MEPNNARLLSAVRSDQRLNRTLVLGLVQRLRDEVARERAQFFQDNPELRPRARPSSQD
jgi:hypothetical protein